MCDIFVPNSGSALCAQPWSWKSAEIEIMNFTVTDFKKKSINWQILKCHDFSGCSAQKPIWKCHYPSPQQPCGPDWLWWILLGPFYFSFAGRPLGSPHIFSRRTSALLSPPSGTWGSAHSARRVRGCFWEPWLDHPGGSVMQYLPQDCAFPGQSQTQGSPGCPGSSQLHPGVVGSTKPISAMIS